MSAEPSPALYTDSYVEVDGTRELVKVHEFYAWAPVQVSTGWVDIDAVSSYADTSRRSLCGGWEWQRFILIPSPILVDPKDAEMSALREDLRRLTEFVDTLTEEERTGPVKTLNQVKAMLWSTTLQLKAIALKHTIKCK